MKPATRFDLTMWGLALLALLHPNDRWGIFFGIVFVLLFVVEVVTELPKIAWKAWNDAHLPKEPRD